MKSVVSKSHNKYISLTSPNVSSNVRQSVVMDTTSYWMCTGAQQVKRKRNHRARNCLKSFWISTERRNPLCCKLLSTYVSVSARTCSHDHIYFAPHTITSVFARLFIWTLVSMHFLRCFVHTKDITLVIRSCQALHHQRLLLLLFGFSY